MHPVLFTINEFAVRSYLVIIAVSVLMAIVLIRYYEIPRLRSEGLCPDSLYKYNGEALLIALLFTVIGARLGFVVTNWHLYAANPAAIAAIWRGGLAFHGALLTAIPAAMVHSYWRRIPPGIVLDTAIPYICLAYAFGRLGCFLNGCCYGQITPVPWGLVFPALDSSTRHPTQLYSAAAALLIFGILLAVRRKHYPVGITFAWFLILVGSYRFVVEFFRVRDFLLGMLSLAHLVCLAMILAGLTLLWALIRERGHKA